MLGHPGQQVPHEVHAAPLPAGARQHLADGALESLVGIRDDQANALEPSSHKATEKREPKLVCLGRAHVKAQHLALPGSRHPHGDDRGHVHHAMVLPYLDRLGIQPQVGVLALQGAVPETLHLFVQFRTKPGDFTLADAVQAQRPDQVVDLPGTDALHIRFLHHGDQGPLCPPAWLQQAWEVAALAEFGDPQLDGAHAGIPGPGAIAVPVRLPRFRALVPLSANEFAHLELHELLGQPA